MKKLLWLVFSLLSFLSFLPVNEVYAVSAPDFSTINLQDRFTPVGSSTGTVLGSPANNYIDIVGDERNRSGGIWFDEPLDLNEDFKLEMYFALGWPTGFPVAVTPSEGWAFVMQSAGPTALANEDSGGQSIGVWANNSTSTLNDGAIPNSFAIEFDTFNNDDPGVPLVSQPAVFDHDILLVLGGGSHIAWGYPGRVDTYRNEYVGLIPFTNRQKVMNHQGVRTDRDLNDILGLNNWRSFTVTYTAATSELTYSSYWMYQDVTLKLDRTAFGDDSKQSNVYFGFTGSNSGYAQQRSVAFRRIEIGDKVITPDGYASDSTVDLTGNMVVNDNADPLLDVNTGSTLPVSDEETSNDKFPVEEIAFTDFTAKTNEGKKTFTYNIDAEYKNSASEGLEEGAELTIRVPDIFEIKREPTDLSESIMVDIGVVSVEFEPVTETGFSGNGGEYKRIDNQYIFSLPALSNGTTVSISLPTVVKSDLDLIKDEKIDSVEVFSASFKKDDLFFETGERKDDGTTLRARPCYHLKAIFGPTLSGETDDVYDSLYDSLDEAEIYGKQLSWDDDFSINLFAEDLNSTQVTLYTSKWLDKDTASKLPTFPNETLYTRYDTIFERTSIEMDLSTIVYQTLNEELNKQSRIEGSDPFFKVFYLVDKEGNISSPKYLSILLEPDPRPGNMILKNIPNLGFNTIDLKNPTVFEGFITSSLRDGEVNNPLIESNNMLLLEVKNETRGEVDGWSLNASLSDFYSNAGAGESSVKIPNGSIQIELELESESADFKSLITNNQSLVYERDFVTKQGLSATIRDATLLIDQGAIRAGTFQGAITWELVNSIQ